MTGPHLKIHVTFQYWGHVKNEKSYISTFTRSMDPKINRVVTKDEGTSPTKSHDTSTVWSRGKLKKLHLHFHNAYGPET